MEMKKLLYLIINIMSVAGSAQNLLTPETLWKLGRLSTLGVSKDGEIEKKK